MKLVICIILSIVAAITGAVIIDMCPALQNTGHFLLIGGSVLGVLLLYAKGISSIS
jgi:hypothetical protein